MDAKNAVLIADWEEFEQVAIADADLSTVVEDDSPEFEAEDEFTHAEPTIADRVAIVKGLLADGLISAEDLIDEDNLDQFAEAMPTPDVVPSPHDLSQWSGSPIYYPTREMAQAQADRWGMFWEYHDFGGDAPNGYRYATVPRMSMAPTAPDGYDWVCLPRTSTGL